MKALLLLLIPIVTLASIGGKKAEKAGSLAPDVIQQVLGQNAMKVKACYVAALKQHPDLQGKVIATFRIAATGKVGTSTATGVSEAVSSCIAAVMRSLEFPAPTGGYVDVTYPFIFSIGG